MTIYGLDGIWPNLPASGDYWVAPDATVLGNVQLGALAGVWFGAVIRGDNEPIAIGPETNIQELCMLHSDPGYPLSVGRGCTIGHRAILHGCTIGANCLIGMGAIVLNGATIGDDCLVGAGALVPEGREVPPRSVVLGVPGKVARDLTVEEVAANKMSAAHYVENWRRCAAGLVPAQGFGTPGGSAEPN
jgi:carbonic anhydrase/acetyltransferase-like protein (isoleucine patch superfamily)